MFLAVDQTDPLSDLRLVAKGQQVNVWLQGAGVDHRFVPLKSNTEE